MTYTRRNERTCNYASRYCQSVTLRPLGPEPEWNIMRHGAGNEFPEGGENDDAVILQPRSEYPCQAPVGPSVKQLLGLRLNRAPT